MNAPDTPIIAARKARTKPPRKGGGKKTDNGYGFHPYRSAGLSLLAIMAGQAPKLFTGISALYVAAAIILCLFAVWLGYFTAYWWPKSSGAPIQKPRKGIIFGADALIGLVIIFLLIWTIVTAVDIRRRHVCLALDETNTWSVVTQDVKNGVPGKIVIAFSVFVSNPSDYQRSIWMWANCGTGGGEMPKWKREWSTTASRVSHGYSPQADQVNWNTALPPHTGPIPFSMLLTLVPGHYNHLRFEKELKAFPESLCLIVAYRDILVRGDKAITTPYEVKKCFGGIKEEIARKSTSLQ